MSPKKQISPSTIITRLRANPKLFVLDSNVLMHDPTSLFHFQEHDIYIPMVTLEELDDNKKGISEVARNARQTSRFLDMIIGSAVTDIDDGISLKLHGNKDATGKLFLQTRAVSADLPVRLASGKADNQIIEVVKFLHESHQKRKVTLVSKDINIRIKAHALGLAAEDYFNDKVLEDTDLLFSGILELPTDFWDKHSKEMESWQQSGHTFYRIRGPLCVNFLANQFVYLEHEKPFYAQVKEHSGKTAILQTLKEFTHLKNNVWG
ncbi:MAG: PIN domain-containing protein, partial [Nitrosomonadaceae bacterium]